jgi:hypothetical protein
MKLGTAFGLAITTIIFNRVRTDQSARLGFAVDKTGEGAPLEAQLLAYRAAAWGSFAFGIIGEALVLVIYIAAWTDLRLATLLSAVFLRGVGVVGSKHRMEKSAVKSRVTIETVETIGEDPR